MLCSFIFISCSQGQINAWVYGALTQRLLSFGGPQFDDNVWKKLQLIFLIYKKIYIVLYKNIKVLCIHIQLWSIAKWRKLFFNCPVLKIRSKCHIWEHLLRYLLFYRKQLSRISWLLNENACKFHACMNKINFVNIP